jgi:hypothetical protein
VIHSLPAALGLRNQMLLCSEYQEDNDHMQYYYSHLEYLLRILLVSTIRIAVLCLPYDPTEYEYKKE